MTPPHRFLWGFFGSAAVEVITLHQAYTSRGRTPERYKRIGFWVVRLLLSMIAGGLSVAYNIDNPILAINIGASTPLIVQTLARGYSDHNIDGQ